LKDSKISYSQNPFLELLLAREPPTDSWHSGDVLLVLFLFLEEAEELLMVYAIRCFSKKYTLSDADIV
jgi:hypothetical protein